MILLFFDIQLDPVNSNSLFRILHYFKLKTVLVGYVLKFFTISNFELRLLWTIFHFPCKFEIVGSAVYIVDIMLVGLCTPIVILI